MHMKRGALSLISLCACCVFGGCGVAAGGALSAGRTASPYPDVNLSVRPCIIQTLGLLTLSDLPKGLAPAGTPQSSVGPQSLLDEATDGSVGHADQSFQENGTVSSLSQLAEEVTDYGTVASAERWMLGQEASNRPNDIPMYGNGVEATPKIPVMGDDALLYQIDKGAPYDSGPYTGPFVGDIYTDIQVREGDVIYALSIDSGPDANSAALTVSLVQKLMAKEKATCG
jgi:hypothetical protein